MFAKLYYVVSRFLVWVLSLIYYPITAKGLEHIPRKDGFILASNHESNLDPVVAAIACPRQLKFMAKESLFKGFLGTLIRLGGGFPIRRGGVDRQALKQASDHLTQGHPVIMFVQGTRGGESAQPGVGFIVNQAKMPVVPMWIEGSDKAMPKGSKGLRRHRVTVTFGPIIDYKDGVDHQDVADHIWSSIQNLSS